VKLGSQPAHSARNLVLGPEEHRLVVTECGTRKSQEEKSWNKIALPCKRRERKKNAKKREGGGTHCVLMADQQGKSRRTPIWGEYYETLKRGSQLPQRHRLVGEKKVKKGK